MSTCYKCGRELPGFEVECEDGCPAEVEMSPKLASAILREIELCRRSKPIDFDKIQTPEQVREFMVLWFHDVTVHPQHPNFEKLKKFFRSE